MINLREFYKDYYDKTLERKNEINNSLSVLVGIITALIAALFYVLINFDFHFNILLSVIFIIFSAMVTFFLGSSVYCLIKAFSDFHDGYNYAYLDSADLLNQYYEELIQQYNRLPVMMPADRIEHAKDKFSNYITTLLIRAAKINTDNNNTKDINRYKCHEALIYSIITLILVLIVFYVNFVFNKCV